MPRGVPGSRVPKPPRIRKKEWHGPPDSINKGRATAAMKVLRLMGLPEQIYLKPQEAYEAGMALLETIKRLEAELTEWEKTQPLEYLELLPWWKGRQEYLRKKEAGEVEELTWWQALNLLQTSYAIEWANTHMWHLDRKHPPTKWRRTKYQ